MAFVSMLNRFYQRAKNIIYAVQALLIFVATMITIAVFTKSGQSDTRVTYFFVLCLICIPFLIYQTAIPTLQRLRKLANAYAHGIIDILLTILWLAAFIGEIVWAKDGTKAAKDFKSGNSTCQVFGYGSTEKCHLGQITTIFGIVICVLFALTTLFSIYGILHYRRTGSLPGTTNVSTDPTATKGDDLEFTGASPHAYDVLHAQQEIQEQQQQQQQQRQKQTPHHLNTTHLNSNNTNSIDPSPTNSPTTIQLREGEETHATLPPRPIYSKAPRPPVATTYFEHPASHDFEQHPAPAAFLHPSPRYQPEQYSPRIPSYEGYRNESGDYDLPGSRGGAAGLPNLRVDTRGGGGGGGGAAWSRVGGRVRGGVAFPAGDYGR